MTGKISEVFEGIQGEGIYLGERQVFVRFFGCNLNCNFCDTRPEHFKEYKTDTLFSQIKSYVKKFHSISFTGGEPLLQKDFLKEILKLTKNEGFINYLETNGTLFNELNEVIGHLDIVAMDFKLPSSTGQPLLWHAHRKFLEIASSKEVFLKAVICSSTQEGDLFEALKLIVEINPSATLVLQPNSQENHAGLKEKLDGFKRICDEHAVVSCIIPQVHKVMGVK